MINGQFTSQIFRELDRNVLHKRNSFIFFVSNFVVLFRHISLCQPYTSFTPNKKAIRAILSDADVNDEELMTTFTGVEALMNSRLLTYQSANPKDVTPLTPNHFLHGQAGGLSAPASVDEKPFNPRKRWRRIQELISHFWKRWIKEWLPLLNTRQKWNETRTDLKVGDIVLAISPGSPRAQWPLVRVLEVFPGQDGHVRVVKLQVGKDTIVRPISKCVPLESNREDEEPLN